MPSKIKIKFSSFEVEVELNDSKTAGKILEALPFKSAANLWGDEIYFTTPVGTELEDPKEVVEKGEVAYWPTGKALCLFFGPTPMSQGDEIRPASAVNPCGKIVGDLERLKKVEEGEDLEVVSGD